MIQHVKGSTRFLPDRVSKRQNIKKSFRNGCVKLVSLLLSAFRKKFLQELEGLHVVCACEGRLHRVSVIDGDKGVSLDPLRVQREPVFMLVGSPNSTHLLVDQLNVLNLRKGDSFAGGNGEEVVLECDSTLSDLDILVIVIDGGGQVHVLYLNNNKFQYHVISIQQLRFPFIFQLSLKLSKQCFLHNIVVAISYSIRQLIIIQFSTIKLGHMSKSAKDIKINPQLRKCIKEIQAVEPDIDQDKLLEKIKERKIVGLPEGVIKLGVRAFFAANPKPVVAEVKPVTTLSQQIQILDDAEPKAKKKVKKNQFIIEFEDSPNYKFQKLGGIQQAYEKIQSELFSAILKDAQFKTISKLPPNRGFLLSGSPGSGKTILANCILSHLANCKEKRISTYSVNSYQFLGGDADDKLRRLFEAADQSAPSIVFIDNLEELCSKENNKRMQSMPSLTLSNYISKLKEKEIFLLGTSSAPEKLDQLTRPGMFYKQIKINNPDDIQKRQILQKLLQSYQHDLTSHLKEMTLLTAGYVAVDFTSLMKEAALKCVQRITSTMVEQQKQKLITIDDVRAAAKEVQPVLKKDGFAKIPTVKLEEVGALHSIKQELTQQIIMPLREQEKFRSMNFEVSGGGILLYGPPGCGKTMIAKAIANEANANFITVKGPQLLTKYVGESEQAVRKVFERARMSAPCIIFFDEFDALAPKRQDQGNQVTQRVVNTLLNELNGVDDRRMVFVIAATNRPDIIDQAVLRSGRIEKHLYVPLPNVAQRLEILQKITMKVNREEDLELEDIANRTENLSGADLYFLVKKSIISAISQSRPKISAQDMKNALETYKQDKYNKKNGLKLTQFQQSDSSDESINLPEEGSTSIKKSRSVMEVNQVSGIKDKKKNRKHENLFEGFMEYLLENKKKNKAQN